MLHDRNVHRSLYQYARGVFQNPTVFSGTFTVYDESDLRAVSDGTLVPVRPCVFVVDSYIRPVPAALPMVVVEIEQAVGRSRQLGDRRGDTYECLYHVLGRFQGERDDLAGVLKMALRGQIGPHNLLPIYDYSGSSPVLLENALIEDEVRVESLGIETSEDMQHETSLDYWHMVRFMVQTKKA